jgi:hypothetical protein
VGGGGGGAKKEINAPPVGGFDGGEASAAFSAVSFLVPESMAEEAARAEQAGRAAAPDFKVESATAAAPGGVERGGGCKPKTKGCRWPGCNYTTSHTAHLRRHLLVHTGERRYA